MEPQIRKTPGVIGGAACIGNQDRAVWMLLEASHQGVTDDQLFTVNSK